MKLRFDHINKQNTEYRRKILDMKNQIKELCVYHNIDIDISDNISVSDSNTEISIIDNSLENVSETNIKMNIVLDEDEVVSQKNDSESNIEETFEFTNVESS